MTFDKPVKVDIHTQEVAGYSLERAKELLSYCEGMRFWANQISGNLSEEEHKLNPYEMAFVISKHEEGLIGYLSQIMHFFKIAPVKYED